MTAYTYIDKFCWDYNKHKLGSGWTELKMWDTKHNLYSGQPYRADYVDYYL